MKGNMYFPPGAVVKSELLKIVQDYTKACKEVKNIYN